MSPLFKGFLWLLAICAIATVLCGCTIQLMPQPAPPRDVTMTLDCKGSDCAPAPPTPAWNPDPDDPNNCKSYDPRPSHQNCHEL
jgi:hypothetical protein